ncbi:polyprenol phosphomannose-dependent alpha 1,6 mannosyltransferase MptB [Actinopolymorpha alba]|uniref:polyprenol phosphomannose-dependent alpha 1,6 mannosyltransferase MptB n=1 Tax=Actinopolymorpha alba TaxID=533267 RepID=UPI0003784E58|nr:polyprenol phosphomannose-dependent alpha 1,6 mannosyltransferase MptB [Actinopolymorpha alba]
MSSTAATSVHSPVASHRAGRRALVFCGASFALFTLTGLLGPSAVTLTLPQRVAWRPPYWFDVHPAPWLVMGLVYAGLVVGAYGLFVAFRALAAGWQPSPRRLVALGVAGVTALTLVPPMASGDVLMYAAYGRIAALGGDPYVTSPAAAALLGHDPVIAATERPWQNATSVYGPVATWIQEAAARIGDGSTHGTMLGLQVVNAVAFVLTGLLTVVLAGSGDVARARAVLFVLANPLLVWAVVGGAHNDAQAVVFAVAALVVVRRSPFASGLLLGLGGAIKLTVGLYGLALLWCFRRSPRSALSLCAGALLTLGGTYLTAGPQVFDRVLLAPSFISSGTPWRLLFGPLHLYVLPMSAARAVIASLATVAIVLLAVLLFRALPRPVLAPAGVDDPRPEAVRASAAICLAWVFLTQYSLPWYDLMAWVPLAGLVATRLDLMLLGRTAMMAAAYVPGRVVVIPLGLAIVSDRIRDTVTPLVQTAILVWLVSWCLAQVRGRVRGDDEGMPPPEPPIEGGRPVLLYDGDCAFCTRSVRLIERWIRPSAALEPWQFADLDALGTTRARAEYEVLWVRRDRRVDGGAQAVARLLIHAGGGWALLGWSLRVPPIRWLAHLVYRLVANNRDRLPGGTPACALPADQRPGASSGA